MSIRMFMFLYCTICLVSKCGAFNCRLPRSCRVQDVDRLTNNLGNDNFYSIVEGIRCDLNAKFEFDFRNVKILNASQTQTPILNEIDKWCAIDKNNSDAIIEFKWPTGSESILLPLFNIQNLLSYLSYFQSYVNFHFINLKGFELSLFRDRALLPRTSPKSLSIISSTVSFYANGVLMKTCDEITNKLE